MRFYNGTHIRIHLVEERVKGMSQISRKERKIHVLIATWLLAISILVSALFPMIVQAQPPDSYLFADGYESGSYSAWTGPVISPGNALSVVTEQANSGSYSSKSVWGGGLWAESEKYGLGTNNSLYARGYFGIASGWSIAKIGARFETLMLATAPPGKTRARATVCYDGRNLQWRLVAWFGSGTQDSGNLQVINPDQWYSIELYYVRNATLEQAKMWIDGVLKSTLTGSAPSPEIMNVIFVGFHYIHALAVGDSLTTFSDDVVADDDYIGPKREGNTSPVASDLTISPSSPSTADNLVGSYTYYDADGDPESGTEIRWYKDNALQPLYNDTLIVSSSSTSIGEVWHFTAQPKDGNDFGTLQISPSVIIAAPSPYIFSDGFETGDFSAWNGRATGFDDTVSVVSEDSYEGFYSARSIVNGGGHAFSYESFSDQRTVHVRWYFKFTADLPDALGEEVWLSLLLGDNGGTEIVRVGIGYYSGSSRITVYNVRGSTYYGSTSVNPDTWYCVEFRFYKSSSGEYKVWLNGAQEISVGLDLSGKPDADQVRIGIARWTSLSPTLYSDSVVVADKQIGI